MESRDQRKCREIGEEGRVKSERRVKRLTVRSRTESEGRMERLGEHRNGRIENEEDWRGGGESKRKG